MKETPNYLINENGEVYSLLTKKILKPRDQGHGYFKYLLTIAPNELKNFYIHRLVYNNFIGDLDDEGTIDHIDGDKNNNCFKNLQQVSREENTKLMWERRKNESK